YVWSASSPALLAPGASFTFTVTVVLGSVCVDTTVCNLAVVEANTPCVPTVQPTNQVCTSIAAPVPSVAVVKTQTPASPVAGDVVTYRLVVSNNGSATLTGIAVNDTV